MRVLIVAMLFFTSSFANEYLNAIYENILLKNTQEAIEATKSLEKSIAVTEQAQAKEQFVTLIKRWKSVQNFYVLGDLDSSYIDTPRYIDIYHHGNEDITVQLKRVIQSSEALSISLFKHSYKSINALEYILYEHDLNQKRVKDIALIITETIREYLNDIKQGYQEHKEAFLENEQKANAMMLNALIESSYKLKEWRIGDPAGLSRKYDGDPDSRRGEYFLSKNSDEAVAAIINTHLQVLDKQDFKNYGSLIRSYGIQKQLDASVEHLKEAKKKLHLIKDEDFSNAKALFNELNRLHISYYITLIGELKITAKVLDADGD